MNTVMKNRIVSRFRHSRVLRLATSAVIACQVLIGTPVFAEEVVRFGVYASGRFSNEVAALAQGTAAKTVRKTTRLAADAKRKLAKARVRVNRTVPMVTSPVHEVAFGVNVSTDMIRSTRLFEEPLIPTSEPGADENRALAQLLQSIASMSRDQQVGRVDAYLQEHPMSP